MSPCNPIERLAMVVLTSLVLATSASAQDKNAERAQRRLQLQLQQVQEQLQEAQAATARVEAEKAALAKQLSGQAAEIPKAQGAARRAADALKLAAAEKADLAARLAATEAQLADQKNLTRQGEDALTAANAKNAELTQTLARRDAAQAQQQVRWQVQSEDHAKQIGECTAKNTRLVQLSAELLDRYKRKGVREALKQNEPLLGLGDVEMFNLVQDYRDKAEAERYSSGAPADPTR